MTLAAINWLDIIINLLLVVFVVVCLLMSLIILMQRPKQEGLGAAFGGGVTDQVFGARTTNVLQRGTVYLGTLFFVLSLVLAILIGQQNKSHSLLTHDERAQLNAPAVETPAVEEPKAPESLQSELPAETTQPAETPAPEETPADAPSETTPPVEVTPEASETTPAESQEAPAEASQEDASGN